MNIETMVLCQTLFLCFFSRLLAFSETKNQINQPTNKREKGNNSPERFLTDGAEILANDIDDCQNRQQVKEKADGYPKGNGCLIQFTPSVDLLFLTPPSHNIHYGYNGK